MNMKKITCRGWITACALFLIAGSASAASFPPLPEAIAAMTSDAEVTVTEITVPEWPVESNFYYAFEPTVPGPAIGFIIYPGALMADPRSYAPAAHEIARRGFPSFIVKMAGDVAIGETVQRATRVMNDHPGIEKWARRALDGRLRFMRLYQRAFRRYRQCSIMGSLSIRVCQNR